MLSRIHQKHPHQATPGQAPQQQRAAPPAEAALIAPWAAIREVSSHPCQCITRDMKPHGWGPAGSVRQLGEEKAALPSVHQQTRLHPALSKCQPRVRYHSGASKSKLENATMYF